MLKNEKSPGEGQEILNLERNGLKPSRSPGLHCPQHDWGRVTGSGPPCTLLTLHTAELRAGRIFLLNEVIKEAGDKAPDGPIVLC